jgi:hypothetical protein
MPQITILALRELLPHLLLLFGPVVHHITKARNSFRPVMPKVSVDAWVGDAVVEAVDDVTLRDVRDGSANVEEATSVGPQELFTLSKIMTIPARAIAPWKLSMKTFLSRSQESIELLLRLSSHVSGAGSKAIGK